MSLARSKNYIPGRQSAHGGVKKIYRCFPRLAVHLYLIGPICQFAPSTRGAWIGPGADPIFRSACCAGYCQDNGAGNGGCGGREMCAVEFSSKISTDLEPVFPTCSRNMIGTRPHLRRFMLNDALYVYNTSVTWIALFEFSNGQNIRNYRCRNQESFDRHLKHNFCDEKRKDIKTQRSFFYKKKTKISIKKNNFSAFLALFAWHIMWILHFYELIF